MTPFRRIISRTSLSGVSFHVIAFVAIALAWTNAGASTPPPNDALDAASAALTSAATPDGDRYAPDELAAAHREQLDADVRDLVEKYLAIAEWDVPEIDEPLSTRLITAAIRQALDRVEDALPDSPQA